jgi:HEAT repeats
MLGWFAPRCPVNTVDKTWAETRMRWLADRLGIDRLLKAQVILPTDEHFPDPYGGDLESVRRMMDRLCGYLGLEPGAVKLEVCSDEQMPGATGHYDRVSGPTTVRVAESQLADAEKLAATLAHELAHEILLGRGLLSRDAPDHEWVTDLLPVFLGVGVFAANATVHEQTHRMGAYGWWQISKQGYLPARLFGYALALFAFMRGERSPEWADNLRLDASSALKAGLHYLRKTGDTLFHPDTIRQPRRPPTALEVVDRLRTGTPSVRLAALWDIHEHGLTDSGCLAAVIERLRDPDPAIPGEAAHVLPDFGPAAEQAVPGLIAALRSSHDDTRAGAAYALGALGLRPAETVPELYGLLGDRSPAAFVAAAHALARFGAALDPTSLRRLLAGLESALVDCDYGMATTWAGALLAMAPDPEAAVADYFDGDDKELRRLAVRTLKELRKSSGAES